MGDSLCAAACFLHEGAPTLAADELGRVLGAGAASVG